MFESFDEQVSDQILSQAADFERRAFEAKGRGNQHSFASLIGFAKRRFAAALALVGASA